MTSRRPRLRAVVGVIALLISMAAAAKVVEDKRWIAAKVINGSGKEVSRQIMVTIFYDDAAPQP